MLFLSDKEAGKENGEGGSDGAFMASGRGKNGGGVGLVTVTPHEKEGGGLARPAGNIWPARPGGGGHRLAAEAAATGGRWRQWHTLPCCAEGKHGREKASIGGPFRP
jgi:hypothetical protein